MTDQYDDIIELPHHVSKKRKQMTLEERAGQFAPFAALSGYHDEINKHAKMTKTREHGEVFYCDNCNSYSDENIVDS